MPFFMTRTFFWPPPIPTGGEGGAYKGAIRGPQAGGAISSFGRRGSPYIQPGTNKKGPALAREQTSFTSETARVAAGRPKSRSLAPLRGVLPFLRPYRGRIAVAAVALLASSSATLVLPQFLRGLINAQGLSAAQAHALTGFY